VALCASGWMGSATAAMGAEKPVIVSFNPMAGAATVAQMASTFTAATIKVFYNSGRMEQRRLAYHTLFKTGQTLPRTGGGQITAGGYFMANGQPLIDNKTGRQMFSDCPDGQSLIKLDNVKAPGVKGNTLFLVTQFEYLTKDAAGIDMYGKLPSPIGVATIDQDPKTGHMKAVSYHNVDTSGVHGLWITCAGSVSPWNTHLSSEEYEPDAFKADSDEQFKAFSLNTLGVTGNPYHYGHVPEVTVQANGTATIKKHYNMGRISRELVQVMPDRRTVLMGDDYTGGGMFMFIADREEDLSSGTLYVAKGEVHQSRMKITWIRMGHANSAEIEQLANRLHARNIMDVQKDDPKDAAYTLAQNGKKKVWIKVHPGMEKAAAFLETHRYAGVLGGTMEFTKFEGVCVNVADKKAYLAISAIKDTMSDKDGQWQEKKISAGAVFEAQMGNLQKDSNGAVIESIWVPTTLAPIKALVGKDLKVADAAGNNADIDFIANPDNVKFSDNLRTLFIGEDSGMHLNNIVWAYNVDTELLTRVLSVPAGAECTGLEAVDNCNGHAYLMSNFQHAGDRKFTPEQKPLSDAIARNWGGNTQAAVGYVSGLPCLG
jgi:uncharacterized protein